MGRGRTNLAAALAYKLMRLIHTKTTANSRPGLTFSLQAPLLPYMVKQLGADASYYGMLQSSFSALQLLGGLLSGTCTGRLWGWGGVGWG